MTPSAKRDDKANQNTRAKLIGDLVSILGAAIVFFSWIITNTLQQEYLAAKAGVQRAASDHRMYANFQELGEAVAESRRANGEFVE